MDKPRSRAMTGARKVHILFVRVHVPFEGRRVHVHPGLAQGERHVKDGTTPHDPDPLVRLIPGRFMRLTVRVQGSPRGHIVLIPSIPHSSAWT